LIAAITRTTNAGVIDPLLKITKIAEEKKYGKPYRVVPGVFQGLSAKNLAWRHIEKHRLTAAPTHVL
jgi:glutamate/tyrosine decarboxylase-like PLP-dependent enzyme